MGANRERAATGRRELLAYAAGVGTGAAAGCLDRAAFEGESRTENESQSDDGSARSDDETVSVGMVYASAGLGDKSFSDMAHRGVQQAGLDYGIAFDYEEPKTDDEMGVAQRTFAAATDPGYDLVCCIGFEQSPGLAENAPAFREQPFAVVDTIVDEPNVASYVFEDHEGSFQIGYLAARMTTTELRAGGGSIDPDESVVGFVGGMEIPPVKKFEAGYRAGVEYAGEDVTVLSEYVGDFADPDGGKEAASAMYERGADIVYHAAGRTGTGVFQAAQMHGRFAVGVDADQSRSDPRYADVILASMTKRVDTAVYLAIESVVDEAFDGGDVVPLGLDDGGVKTVYGAQLGDSIPEALKDDIAEIGTEIADGGISVPTEP